MSVLSFLKYPFRSVARHTRRSLFAIAGIVIALSLISGSWIAVDSSGMGMLRSRLDQIPVDFIGYDESNPSGGINETYAQTKLSAIDSVDDVVDSGAFAVNGGWYYANDKGESLESDWGGNFSGNMLFMSEEYGRFFTGFRIDGQLPNAGTVAVPAFVADRLNLSVGDNLTCRYEKWSDGYDEWGNLTSWVEYLNLSFRISAVWTQDKSFLQEEYYWYSYGHADDERWISIKEYQNPVVFRLADLPSVETPAKAFDASWDVGLRYLIWADRDAVVDLADLRGSVGRVQKMERDLQREGMLYGFRVYDNYLVGPLESLDERMAGIKPLFVSLSLPVVALGVYLSIVGVDLGVNERKREIAILKSRGASNRQVFVSLIVESLMLGAFAGILGLALGILVSRFLLDVATAFSYQGSGNALTSDFMMSTGTITWSVLFGVALMLVSSYRPFKKISKTDVKEALHYFSPAIAQIDYKPRADIIMLSLSAISIFSVWVGLEWVSEMEEVSWITRLILTIMVLIGVMIFPLMPFLLSLSVIRLLTRGSRRLYAKLTFLVKPFTKEMHYLVDKNIVRNPRRASNLCLIIALALAFGLFISVTMESTMRYQEDLIKFEVGSEIRTEASFDWQVDRDEFNLAHLQTISDVEGVESFVLFENIRVWYGFYGGGYSTQSVAFDAREYKEVVVPDGFYFVDGGSEMLDDIADINGTVLVSTMMAEMYSLEPGNSIPLVVDYTDWYTYPYETKQINFIGRVAGIVKGLPGLQDYQIFMDSSSLNFVPQQNRTEAVNSYGAFVDVAPGYSQSDIASDVEDVFIDAGLSPSSTTVDEKLEELKSDVAYQALTDFLYMEYVLSVVIMTIGVGILIFVAVNDREKELASILARGSSAGQIRKMLMGESITLMSLGLLVGASVGLLTAYLFQTLFTSGEESTVVPSGILFTWISAAIVVASVLALVLASLLATSRAGKIKLAEVLRIRGG